MTTKNKSVRRIVNYWMPRQNYHEDDRVKFARQIERYARKYAMEEIHRFVKIVEEKIKQLKRKK